MRFTITNLLLLGTALAAPIQEVEQRTSKATQHDSLITRGLVPILPRIVEPIAPKPIEPVVPKPVEPLEPANPNGPDDTPGLRPEEPAAPGTKPEDPTTPGLKPEEPAPAKPVPVDRCLLKRCAPPLPGAKASLNFDKNYERKSKIAPKDDEDIPSGAYIDESGLGPKDLGPDDHWYETTVDNSLDNRKAFEIDIVPKYEYPDDPVKGPWTDKEKKEFIENEMGKFGPESEYISKIVVTKELPKKGAVIVESSYNAGSDLYRKYPGFDMLNERKYVRPGIDENKKIRWSEMVMDNWRVAAKDAKVDVKDLKMIGRDNIQTLETRDMLKNLMGTDKKKTLLPGSQGFNDITERTHGDRVAKMLEDNKVELDNLKITSYEVFKLGEFRYDIMIHLGRA